MTLCTLLVGRQGAMIVLDNMMMWDAVSSPRRDATRGW